MKHLLTSFYAKPLAFSLVLSLLLLSTVAGPAEAMMVPAAADAERGADLATVQKALESKVLQQRLLDYGLTPHETAARISALSDEQVHQLAAHLESVQAGGDVVGGLFALALIAAIVVLIIFILQGRIAVERR